MELQGSFSIRFFLHNFLIMAYSNHLRGSMHKGYGIVWKLFDDIVPRGIRSGDNRIGIWEPKINSSSHQHPMQPMACDLFQELPAEL